MRIASSIVDGRINAKNVLIEMSIKEYLVVGEQILSKNDFQRSKVKRTSTVYSLLRKDLKQNCTFPPIVLALSADKAKSLGLEKDLLDSDLTTLFVPENLIILDGLQRTYNLQEVKEELVKTGDSDSINRYLDNKIRIEIYIGINKIGILYRMLTLNTGQTPMTTRHQIEILYSDYLDIGINDIKLYKQVDRVTCSKIGEYQFDSVIEGFNSYLDRNESGIDRLDILDNIQNLEKLSKENNERDLFVDYLTTFDEFIKKMNELTDGWKYENSNEDIDSIFGKDILHLFNKAQALSAFGAAIGKLKDNNVIESFDNIKGCIAKLSFSSNVDINEQMLSFLNIFDKIKKNARKIGAEQRIYLKYFFLYLFNPNSDSYLVFDKTINEAYKHYSSFL